MSDLAVGIMSGTSGDGIDAAIVSVDDAGRVGDAIAHRHSPFPEEIRERILNVAAGSLTRSTARDVALLHAALGDLYADAALAIMKDAGERATVIGVHGQTIAHLAREGATLQIGDAARVAVRTEVPTVCDFRSADVAAGGQGAPLTPFADHLLFAARAPRVIVNIGGIANVTLLPDADREHVRGFDTGPGNMVIDAIARTAGHEFDRDGGGALRGNADRHASALENALEHPFFSTTPPKSAGREEFGASFAEELLARVRAAGGSTDDALAVATALTARTIADAITGGRDAQGHDVRWREVLVGGGGAKNPALMSSLARAVAPVPVRRTDEVGIPAAAREAIAFAILAAYRLRGLPNTLPGVTGARHAVCAGAVHRP